MSPIVPEIINCSTVYAGNSAAVATAAALSEGYEYAEFWWPFDREEPTPREVNAFCELFSSDQTNQPASRGSRLKLYAMNVWGGDMAAGQRGVLRQRQLSESHLEAVSQIARKTGLKCSNVLLGRGGKGAGELTGNQVRRLAELTERLAAMGVQALVEPLSGMSDYPITDPWTADRLAKETGAGVLADFYHLCANGVDVEAWLRDVEKRCVALPAHVQIADFPGRGAPGSGEAPLNRWVARLLDAGYAGAVAGEWI